ncbi:MAG: hypothetical protein V4534_08825 [Myxococcota bacterium]
MKYLSFVVFSCLSFANLLFAACPDVDLGKKYNLTLHDDGLSVLNGSWQVNFDCLHNMSGRFTERLNGKITSGTDLIQNQSLKDLNVVDVCNVRILFSLVNEPNGFRLQQANGTCLAKVAFSDADGSEVILRNCAAQPLARVLQPSTSENINVQILNASVMPQLVPYTLAFLHMHRFRCPALDIPAESGISTKDVLAIVAAVILIGSFLVSSAFVCHSYSAKNGEC